MNRISKISFITFTFLIAGVVGEDVINGSSTVGTFTFVMANSRTSLGASCLKFSNYYCLLRLNLPQPRLPPSSEIASSQSRDNSQKNKSTRRFPKPVTRVARKDDVDKCQELMWSFFSHINFFSFLKDDMPFGCCDAQIQAYVLNGQRNSMSPRKYMSKLMDYSDRSRRLVEVRWIPRLAGGISPITSNFEVFMLRNFKSSANIRQ
ncbi:uncharacterized protein LOC142340327 [Convolutriloba macropyga]|uniref:uncharacterized protein LOC142340327 n=1 Tax=Convolutriloba macropyga TaxID=536237 RepID=UPI003F520B47